MVVRRVGGLPAFAFFNLVPSLWLRGHGGPHGLIQQTNAQDDQNKTETLWKQIRSNNATISAIRDFVAFDDKHDTYEKKEETSKEIKRLSHM